MESTNAEGVKKRGAWSDEEDTRLKKCIEVYGEGRWHLVPLRAGLNRCRKSCRLRWVNYLNPNIKRGHFNVDEVDLLIRVHRLVGNRWSLIAGRIPGRTANDVKNFWNTHIMKLSPSLKVSKPAEKPEIIKPKPHNMSKLVAVSNKPFNEEPLQISQWCSNVLDTAETNNTRVTTLFPIQNGSSPEGGMAKKSHAGDNCPIQIDGGNGMSECSMGFWRLLGFDDF